MSKSQKTDRRFVCVHGHFYQPPRESPWLESIELQDSAYPYHDWNERIDAECYAANAASRILDEERRIRAIVNNYSRISFNLGPTLLSWLERHAPFSYGSILTADEESRDRFQGHGSAIAQVYNHVIMPLANERDQRCQVVWGIRDFVHRFGRMPEGIWLSETAVDLATLEVLADLDLRYTILAPGQARSVRPIAKKDGAKSQAAPWEDVDTETLDTTRAYEVPLPSGKSIAVFFYEGPAAQAIAFENLLDDGVALANQLVAIFERDDGDAQLAHVATDGETYGHHHRHGEMALSYALDHLEGRGLAELTNYGEFLERFPPRYEARIHENSSWSCTHGVERWRSDCGCNSGRAGWNQKWREPLREALDWLRDKLVTLFEGHGGTLLQDPWAAREDYISVLLDRSTESRNRFLEKHARGQLTPDERVTVWKLLELQRNAMLMYTSCGWFFDELSGIETVQVIQYAARAMQLATEVGGANLEPQFITLLERAPSNLPEYANGSGVYEKFVRPAKVGLQDVAAHYAVSLSFESYPESTEIYGHEVERGADRLLTQGRSSLAIGRLRVASHITEEQAQLTYAVLHFGDHNLSGGVRKFRGDTQHAALLEEACAAFEAADMPGTLRILDKHFDGLTYSLRSLFRDEQRRIIGSILEATLDGVGLLYEQLYEQHLPLLRFLGGLSMPLPNALRAAGELVLNDRLHVAIETDPLDVEKIRSELDEAAQDGVTLDTGGLSLALQQALERLAERSTFDPLDPAEIERLDSAVDLTRSMPFDVRLWKVENIVFGWLERHLPALREHARRGDGRQLENVERLEGLARTLNLQV